MSHLTTVMYHYVRPMPDPRFPALKALSLDQFDAQLDYICRHYTVVSMEAVIDSLDGGKPLPSKAVLLSFDDGYIDHFEHVLPRLKKRGLSGAFYPPRRAVIDREILDVNKIQFILATGTRPKAIADAIRDACRESGSAFQPGDMDSYTQTYPHPFDSKEVLFVKQMLGQELPNEIRGAVTDSVFRRYVAGNQQTFADDLYLSEGQLREMVLSGMHVGSHGDAHHWMDQMSPDGQLADIERSLDLLETIGMSPAYRSFCYPYGGYNAATLEALKHFDFKAALTCIVELGDIDTVDPLQLPRLDTNDLPKQSDAAPNEWTLKAAGLAST